MVFYIFKWDLVDENVVVVLLNHRIVVVFGYQLVRVDCQQIGSNEGENIFMAETLWQLVEDLSIVYELQFHQVAQQDVSITSPFNIQYFWLDAWPIFKLAGDRCKLQATLDRIDNPSLDVETPFNVIDPAPGAFGHPRGVDLFLHNIMPIIDISR